MSENREINLDGWKRRCMQSFGTEPMAQSVAVKQALNVVLAVRALVAIVRDTWKGVAARRKAGKGAK
ncbi:MAG: hypothetical protein WBG50_02215 [Desulfomonilaceae bacterium]